MIIFDSKMHLLISVSVCNKTRILFSGINLQGVFLYSL
uniref:Uncharacterized protein n=1 Tax=uncultured Desulfobacterium sp. TaxID=201089 RepID=E1Y8M6_9BACT|nr:unknown protein [uncultured Desulfobacterium sp.]